ncbi:MAG TPA: PleD family two-component system response regulator [Candidatus Sulfotelmatobacter sp.]|nr:PleD family two-component system response regulator [Candidatus Sulfotelmatobacter sp.]
MPGRVLIVDDIAPNLKLLEAKLSSEYYDVITADNGHKAIAMARRESPDLVLLDIMMPGLDGFAVCEILKSDPMTAHIPIVMVTALSDVADRVRGLQAGADDFLSKPVRDVPLFARVRSLIRLKQLMDVYLVREETSTRLGLASSRPLLSHEDATHGRVLVIDDSDVDVGNLMKALAPDEHRISRLASTENGLAAASREEFDLLIVSLHIDGSDVLRFCSQIRSHVADRVRSLPILLLAEDDDEMRVAKGLDLGVNDYVLKPVDPQELLARVRTQIRRRRYQNRLRINYEQSIALASTDPLTGVHNRRYLDTHLDQLLQRARANAKPLSVAFCDIDHFKKLNDSYGHAAGDEVLIEFTRRLLRNLRSHDLVARIGGEEFVVVMPDTPPERARRIAERLRQKVEQEPFTVGTQATPIAVTISVGVTTSRVADAFGVELIKRADEAMYQAKNSGRNRVVVAPMRRASDEPASGAVAQQEEDG